MAQDLEAEETKLSASAAWMGPRADRRPEGGVKHADQIEGKNRQDQQKRRQILQENGMRRKWEKKGKQQGIDRTDL